MIDLSHFARGAIMHRRALKGTKSQALQAVIWSAFVTWRAACPGRRGSSLRPCRVPQTTRSPLGAELRGWRASRSCRLTVGAMQRQCPRVSETSSRLRVLGGLAKPRPHSRQASMLGGLVEVLDVTFATACLSDPPARWE